MDQIRLTQVTLSVTSGTLELQHVNAKEAFMADRASKVVVSDLDIEAAEPGRPTIKAQAEQGTIVIGAPKARETDRVHPPTQAQILAYGRDFESLAANGDIMLSGVTKPASGRVDNQGSIESNRIIWSDKYDRVIIPEPFKQEGKGKDGSTVYVEGAALSVDRGFTNWEYFTDKERSGLLKLGGAGAPEKDSSK